MSQEKIETPVKDTLNYIKVGSDAQHSTVQVIIGYIEQGSGSSTLPMANQFGKVVKPIGIVLDGASIVTAGLEGGTDEVIKQSIIVGAGTGGSIVGGLLCSPAPVLVPVCTSALGWGVGKGTEFIIEEYGEDIVGFFGEEVSKENIGEFTFVPLDLNSEGGEFDVGILRFNSAEEFTNALLEQIQTGENHLIQLPDLSSNVETQGMESYTIQSGDTLSEIAEKKGISLEELQQANPQITNPDQIQAGESLNLPLHSESFEDLELEENQTKPTTENKDSKDNSPHENISQSSGAYETITNENGNPIELASTDASDAQVLVDQYNESQEDKQANQESQTHESNESSQEETLEANESSQEETPAEPSILSGGQTASIVSDAVYGAYSEHWNLNQAFVYKIKKAA